MTPQTCDCGKCDLCFEKAGEPRFKRTCGKCVFLGRSDEVDLYYCHMTQDVHVNVADFSISDARDTRYYETALRLATEKGFMVTNDL